MISKYNVSPPLRDADQHYPELFSGFCHVLTNWPILIDIFRSTLGRVKITERRIEHIPFICNLCTMLLRCCHTRGPMCAMRHFYFSPCYISLLCVSILSLILLLPVISTDGGRNDESSKFVLHRLVFWRKAILIYKVGENVRFY